jgi:hypothetical protein
MQTQPYEGQDLDKDLLGDGKLYSPNTCCFLPQSTNKFISGLGKKGWSWYSQLSKFHARCYVQGVEMHLGYFDTPEAAHKAWRAAKQEEGLTHVEALGLVPAAFKLWDRLLEI